MRFRDCSLRFDDETITGFGNGYGLTANFDSDGTSGGGGLQQSLAHIDVRVQGRLAGLRCEEDHAAADSASPTNKGRARESRDDRIFRDTNAMAAMLGLLIILSGQSITPMPSRRPLRGSAY
jgi:hypothetical protein